MSINEMMVMPTLSELAVIINREHECAIGSARTTLVHGIACGEALLAADRLCPPRQWTRWLAENVAALSLAQCYNYMRVAQHKDKLLAYSGPQTIVQAKHYLRDIGAEGRLRSAEVDVDVALARRLRSEGMSYNAIAKELGVSAPTVKVRLEPPSAKRVNTQRNASRARRRAERAALAKSETDAAVKRRGGDASKVYALLRQAEQMLDSLSRSDVGHDERERYRTALGLAHKAEDEIVRALRIGRQA